MEKNLTIVIPVHKIDDNISGLLHHAILSVPQELPIIISTVKDVVDKIKDYLKDLKVDISYSVSDGSSDFCSLVNNAEVKTKWFSILEFDDEYTDIWYNNVKKYLEYKNDISVLMCMEDLFDFSTMKYMGIGNNAPWALSFSNEIGMIDNDCLQTYFDFYLTGSVFNTDDFNEVNKLKTNIPISFWYEYLLRITHLGKKVFVMPKVCYKHYLNREDSLIDISAKTMSNEEVDHWFKVARSEYYFKEQRETKPFKKD